MSNSYNVAVYPIISLSGIMEKVTCIKIWEYIYSDLPWPHWHSGI